MKTQGTVALLALTIGLGSANVARLSAQQGENTSIAAEAPQPTRQARQSWTSDRRAYIVGDVITVLIDEQTLATATTSNNASDRRRRDMGVNVGQSVSAAIPRVSATVGSNNDAESRQRGEAVRQNRFVGEMTVRVVGIENGLLQLEGERVTTVDKSRQSLSLAGWVRPQDVSPGNTVESWRIGNAELVYTSSGDLGRPRGGILTRIIGAIWP